MLRNYSWYATLRNSHWFTVVASCTSSNKPQSSENLNQSFQSQTHSCYGGFSGAVLHQLKSKLPKVTKQWLKLNSG